MFIQISRSRGTAVTILITLLFLCILLLGRITRLLATVSPYPNHYFIMCWMCGTVSRKPISILVDLLTHKAKIGLGTSMDLLYRAHVGIASE